MTAAVELTDVVVEAGGRDVLGPLNLSIEEGEHALVVGPSGSGKTTLLRAIAGLATPRAGRITLFGEPVSAGGRILVAPRDRRVGFVFQGGALWPHLTTRRTIELVLRARRVPRSTWADEVARLVTLADLEGFEDRRPGTMSGGEAQRLALARALAAEPRLLLLDEPLGSLDGDRRHVLSERLGALQQELALTTVHVTHDPTEVAAPLGRTFVLESGRLVPSPAPGGTG